ncbi:MAG TPA: hypothetical protein VJS92_10630 [Candidatus Polarisedimenticolaceae bacterium]|nr:hypothetical protein [Candidatus Polarisedimenticolaceae bacterium]
MRVRLGFNLDLPPGVRVNVGNYDPYYIGRVYYQPTASWRRVYAFPVQGPYGVIYRPYIYDGNRVVFADYIPGEDRGYVQFVREGRGHYDPRWHRDRFNRRGHRWEQDRWHRERWDHDRDRDRDRDRDGDRDRDWDRDGR